MKLLEALQSPTRVFRHLFTEQSYERYYSSQIWETKYSKGYELNSPAEDGRYGALLTVMRRYDQGSGLLDAGCGDGLLEEKYRPLSTSPLTGIDYSQAAVEKARARGIPGCEFQTADYRNFRSDGRFSAIVFNESLYYVEDFLGAIDSLGRFLQKDGVLVVSMFDSRVTSRIWKVLKQRHEMLQSISVRDEGSRLSWQIRVFRLAVG